MARIGFALSLGLFLKHAVRFFLLILAVVVFYNPAFSDTIKYEYDELGRLVKVTDTDGSDVDYSFDPAGNRTNQDVVAGAGPLPNFTVSDAQAEEGSDLVFTVTLHNGTGGPYSVDYETQDRTATNGSDYAEILITTYNFGSVTGSATLTVMVTTSGDTTREDNEMMALVLSAPTGGAMLGDEEGVGTILTVDGQNRPPNAGFHDFGTHYTVVTYSNVAMAGCDPDGDLLIMYGGTQPVNESGNFNGSVDYDYENQTFTLDTPLLIGGSYPGDYSFEYTIEDTFGATAVTTAVFTVEFVDPGGQGPNPLTAPSSLGFEPPVIAGCSAPGWEASSDSVSFSIDDITAIEGVGHIFTVTKTGAATQNYSIEYATADGTATLADSDYTSTSGGLTFTPAQTTKTITVSTTIDGNTEGSETFYVNLANASGGANFSDNQALGTLADGGPPVDNASFAINDVSFDEGDNLVFTVTKSGTASQDYSVDFASADGTATLADSDYTANSGTLTFTSVETTKTITIITTTDGTIEPDETVFVNLSNQTGTSTIADAQGVGTIIDDDAPTPDNASFSIDDVSELEGTSLVFTVTKSGTASQDYSVDFATADGTATLADNDYTATSGTLTFTSAQTTKTITIITTTDGTIEPDETVFVNLTNQTGTSTITDAQGVGMIENDDTETPPSFAFSAPNVTIPEGGVLTFTVTKTGTVSQSYSVDFATADDTATLADSDYTANSGTLTFTSAQTSKTVTVQTTNDSTVEPDETVLVNLSNATGGATITQTQDVGTIENDDTAPNQPPTAVDDSFLGAIEGEINDISVLVNDSDPDNDPLTITSLSNVNAGFTIATIACSNTCIRVQSGIGTYTLTYHISDGNGGTDSAILTYKAIKDFGLLFAPPSSEEETETPPAEESGGQ